MNIASINMLPWKGMTLTLDKGLHATKACREQEKIVFPGKNTPIPIGYSVPSG